jgi:hypothetical protein
LPGGLSSPLSGLRFEPGDTIFLPKTLPFPEFSWLFFLCCTKDTLLLSYSMLFIFLFILVFWSALRQNPNARCRAQEQNPQIDRVEPDLN